MKIKSFFLNKLYVIDSKQIIVNALSAQTMGDVFILTPGRRIIYRGPVDDQYQLSKSTFQLKKQYLRIRVKIN